MADRDTGGPAFPIETTATPYAEGMTLRDWFAGQVAGALVRRAGWPDDWERIAPVSYEIADAMLEARKQ